MRIVEKYVRLSIILYKRNIYPSPSIKQILSLYKAFRIK